MGVNYKIKGKNVYLDANVFIYLLEGYQEFIPLLTQLFSQIDEGIIRGTTSELTLAETLVKPVLDNNHALQKTYEEAIQSSPILDVISISRDILISAAKLRKNSIRLPDAIHVATAYANNCHLLITNDKRLKSISKIDVVLLSELKDSILT